MCRFSHTKYDLYKHLIFLKNKYTLYFQSYPREVQQVEPQGRRRAAAGEGRRANVKVQGHQDMNDKRQTASHKNRSELFFKKNIGAIEERTGRGMKMAIVERREKRKKCHKPNNKKNMIKVNFFKRYHVL